MQRCTAAADVLLGRALPVLLSKAAADTLLCRVLPALLSKQAWQLLWTCAQCKSHLSQNGVDKYALQKMLQICCKHVNIAELIRTSCHTKSAASPGSLLLLLWYTAMLTRPILYCCPLSLQIRSPAFQPFSLHNSLTCPGDHMSAFRPPLCIWPFMFLHLSFQASSLVSLHERAGNCTEAFDSSWQELPSSTCSLHTMAALALGKQVHDAIIHDGVCSCSWHTPMQL